MRRDTAKMKRCPQCNRIERDKTLAFCRVDGAALISDSASSSGDTSTVKFAAAPVSNEIETRILPEPPTTPEIIRPAAPTTAALSEQPGTVGLEIIVQLQAGERQSFRNSEWAGTKNLKRGLEGFSLRIVPQVPGLSLRYRGHFEDVGDLDYLDENRFLTPKEPKRLEGFSIELTGSAKDEYDVCYMAHVADWGDTRIFKNGDYCGTQRESRRVEAMKVWIAARQQSQPSLDPPLRKESTSGTSDSTSPPELEIAHVLFMDIVGYSKLSTIQQPQILQKLGEVVRSTNEFRHKQASQQLISLPTGDVWL